MLIKSLSTDKEKGKYNGNCVPDILLRNILHYLLYILGQKQKNIYEELQKSYVDICYERYKINARINSSLILKIHKITFSPTFVKLIGKLRMFNDKII